jgi:hypothetical protein
MHAVSNLEVSRELVVLVRHGSYAVRNRPVLRIQPANASDRGGARWAQKFTTGLSHFLPSDGVHTNLL